MFSPKKILRDFFVQGGLLKTKLSEEELAQVIDASTLSGTLDKTEHELIKSILQFSDITAKEIMVPRPDIVALDIEASRENIIQKVAEEGYSRLPVFRGTIDRIVGVIYSKDILSLMEHKDVIVLQDLIRPAYFVPGTIKISKLLREFQKNKLHLGVIVDEFGGTEGLITMEDIIEEIVGDILDEYDEVQNPFEKKSDGSIVVDAAMTIGEFNEHFPKQIPEDSDYETLAGYLQKKTGRLPEIKEEIRTENFIFTILTKSARRIRQVKVLSVHGGELEPIQNVHKID
jgi:CBS domain containing-hemolysin-like protein